MRRTNIGEEALLEPLYSARKVLAPEKLELVRRARTGEINVISYDP